MSLSEAKLKGKILNIFKTKRMEPDPDRPGQMREVTPTMILFAKELSDAYDDYAQDSETYAGDKLIATGKSTMRTILETLDAPGNTASIVALIIHNSILAYWNGCSYALAPFPPDFSVVFNIIVHPPTVPSNIGLEAAMMAGGSDSEQAGMWAASMHSQTISVKTTHSGLDTTVPVPLPKTDSNKAIS